MPWRRSLLALTLFASVAVADDWPQWLGPNRDGSTVEKIAPWKGDLKNVWSVPVAEGHSSPVIAGGCVYLHSCLKGKDVETIQCLEASSGKEIWHYDYPRGPFEGLFGR